jgi:uncharacterized protein
MNAKPLNWSCTKDGVRSGCVYTAQGFEFDYIGVIFGEDLVYDFDKQQWIGHIEKSSDSVVKRSKKRFLDLIKNTYRVLLSRGMKGCYVYFMDKDTERFIKSRIEIADTAEEKHIKADRHSSIIQIREKIIKNVEDAKQYSEYLPVYSLKAAAGYFGDGMIVEEEGWIKVNSESKLNKRMFVARIVGNSMEPMIHDGNYCVFRAGVHGTRNNKIVLVQHSSIKDPDTGGSYAVKKYTSKKRYAEDGTWQHEEIVLEPLNKSYEPILIVNPDEGEFNVIAEFLKVLQIEDLGIEC